MATAFDTATQSLPGFPEIQYTDVVVIGNGPSGITLSYMLSGYTPYYTGAGLSDEYLHNRLMDGKGQSLYEQDLDYLSTGLEGRSNSTVALLFDALTHPDADLGYENKSLLEWRHLPQRAISHVVLGRYAPGGVWQSMDGTLETLSMGNWMQLPDLPFREWLEDHHFKQNRPVTLKQDRASMQDVRMYYEDYVNQKGLSANFHSGTTVTRVERVLDVCHSIDSESGEQIPCSHPHHGKHKWEVRGFQSSTDPITGETSTQDFCYRAPDIVLATGTSDNPNHLRITGEARPYMYYSLGRLEQEILSGHITPSSDPVVIVGAGLSAADAVLFVREHGIPVAHVFRREASDPAIVYRKLPSKLYPEYHRVHTWMRDGTDGHEEGGYVAYPSHSVAECKDSGRTIIRNTNCGTDKLIQASAVLVQIGARPDLSFLPNSGRNLGIIPDRRVDGKHNPFDIDPFSYQSVHEQGLFAMGPLVGDNFVRFLRGGALAIVSHMMKKSCNEL